jgi:hypothetical protein
MHFFNRGSGFNRVFLAIKRAGHLLSAPAKVVHSHGVVRVPYGMPVRTGRVVPASPFLLPFPAGLDERSRESSAFLNVGHEGIAAETAGNGERVPDVLDKEIAKILVE